jgi:hypothetical protein
VYCRITDCKLRHVRRSTVVSWWEIIVCLQRGRAVKLCCRQRDGIISISRIWSVLTCVLVVWRAAVTFTPFVTDSFIARRFVLTPTEAWHSSIRSMLNCFFILSPHFTGNTTVACQRAGISHRTEPGYSGCYGRVSITHSLTPNLATRSTALKVVLSFCAFRSEELPQKMARFCQTLVREICVNMLLLISADGRAS